MTADWHVTRVDLWVIGIICFLVASAGLAVSMLSIAIGFSWPIDLSVIPWIVLGKCLVLFLVGASITAAAVLVFYKVVQHVLER